MYSHSLVLGGTRGLGLCLALEGLQNGEQVAVAGRSIGPPGHAASFDRSLLSGAKLIAVDIADIFGEGWDTDGLLSAMRECNVVYLVAGTFLKGRFTETTTRDIESLVRTHLIGPLEAIRALLHMRIAQRHPVHLVIVSSTSSWKVRDTELVYGMVQAAKAQFTRNLAAELKRDLPGSKVTLVCPGGMKTSFFTGLNVDTSSFMDPVLVARMIRNTVASQTDHFCELHITAGADLAPTASFGPKTPQEP